MAVLESALDHTDGAVKHSDSSLSSSRREKMYPSMS